MFSIRHNIRNTFLGKSLSTTRKRNKKSQVSCKIDASCTSEMRVIEKNKLKVVYVKSHYGHKIQIGHFRLPKSS